MGLATLLNNCSCVLRTVCILPYKPQGALKLQAVTLEALEWVFNQGNCQHTEAVRRTMVPKYFKMKRVENCQSGTWL